MHKTSFLVSVERRSDTVAHPELPRIVSGTAWFNVSFKAAKQITIATLS
ncbi:hypothetical protein ACPXCG_17750 [Gordonia sp. DT218]